MNGIGRSVRQAPCYPPTQISLVADHSDVTYTHATDRKAEELRRGRETAEGR